MTAPHEATRGPHDLGGIEGFGRVPRDEEDHLAWHESVMRMLFALALLGLVRTSGEVRYFVETMSSEEYRSRSYYERWLVAVEALLDRARHADTQRSPRPHPLPPPPLSVWAINRSHSRVSAANPKRIPSMLEPP